MHGPEKSGQPAWGQCERFLTTRKVAPKFRVCCELGIQGQRQEKVRYDGLEIVEGSHRYLRPAFLGDIKVERAVVSLCHYKANRRGEGLVKSPIYHRLNLVTFAGVLTPTQSLSCTLTQSSSSSNALNKLFSSLLTISGLVVKLVITYNTSPNTLACTPAPSLSSCVSNLFCNDAVAVLL